MTTRKPLVSLILVGLIAAAIGFSSPAAAQAPSPSQDAVDLFSDVVQVRVVNLEVVVTDRQGNLISGLEPGDFTLLVDGQEQPIDYFSEVRDGEAKDSDVDGPPGLDQGRSVGTNFLLYVDDNHTLKHERDRVVRGLIDDLGFLGPKDKMAIVVQSGTRLATLADWTNNRVDLRAALDQLLDAKLYGGAFRSPVWTARATSLARARSASDVTRSVPSSRGTFRFGSSLPSLGSQRFLGNPADLPSLAFGREPGFAPGAQFNNSTFQLIDLELAMSGALSTMRGFDVPDGRKVMMMMTGDWPIGGFAQGSSNFNTLTELDVIQPLIETANLLGYTLYPVNDVATKSIWRNASYDRVAARTGGRTLSKRSRVLADAVQDTRSYYWLGFNPDLVGDNQQHGISIVVNQPGLKVRARNSYVDFSRSAQMAMNTQGALLFSEEIADTGLELEFGQPRPVGLRKMSVPATVVIPLDALTRLDIRGEDQIQLELRFAVIDATGAQANVPMIPVLLRGEFRAGDVFEHSTDLTLRRRPHEVLVSIHDPASGKTLLTKSEIAYRQ